MNALLLVRLRTEAPPLSGELGGATPTYFLFGRFILLERYARAILTLDLIKIVGSLSRTTRVLGFALTVLFYLLLLFWVVGVLFAILS